MPTEREILIAAEELYAAGPFGELGEWRDGGVSIWTDAHAPSYYRQMAEVALSAAEKEREADVIEKLREWAQGGLADTGGAVGQGWHRGYLCAMRNLTTFLDAIQDPTQGGKR